MAKKAAPTKQKRKLKLKSKTKLDTDKQVIPRHREKYAALNFKRQVKTRLDQLETDYIDKLSDKDKAWLNAFLEETVITNFQHKGKKFYKSKKAKRELWGTNNARNRCMFTKAKAMNAIVNTENPQALASILDSEYMSTMHPGEYEDAVLEAIMIKRNLEEDDT
jgi:hypothetical protein